MQTKRTKACLCPNCTSTINAASSEEGHTPRAGDLTVCAYCGELLQFNDDMQLIVASDEIFNSLPPAQMLQLLRMQKYFKNGKNQFKKQQEHDQKTQPKAKH